MSSSENIIFEAALHVLKECMDLKKHETLCIVTDEKMMDIAKIFFSAGIEMRCEPVLAQMKERARSGAEPPDHVAKLMESSDVVMAITSKSLSHTQARKKACGNGARIASLPGITLDCAKRTLLANYDEISERSLKIAQILTNGSRVHLTCPLGTDIIIDIAGRDGDPDTGNYKSKGAFGNLPAGEAYIAPMEGKSSGKVIFNSSFAGLGICENPLHIEVAEGSIVSIDGGVEAEKLKSILEPIGPDAYNLAELGIGTNDKAILTGLVLEDEKVMGTVHLAFGDNSGFGGKVSVPVHLDGIILKPTLIVDDVLVMDQGELLV